MFKDLLAFAALRLVCGGRLSFWIPEVLAEEFIVGFVLVNLLLDLSTVLLFSCSPQLNETDVLLYVTPGLATGP